MKIVINQYDDRIDIKTNIPFFERLVIAFKLILSFWGVNISFFNYKLEKTPRPK